MRSNEIATRLGYVNIGAFNHVRERLHLFEGMPRATGKYRSERIFPRDEMERWFAGRNLRAA